jgi:hypothetical protein
MTRTTDRPSVDDRLATVHEQLIAAVEALTSSEAWASMLQVAARFPDYSGGGVAMFEHRELEPVGRGLVKMSRGRDHGPKPAAPRNRSNSPRWRPGTGRGLVVERARSLSSVCGALWGLPLVLMTCYLRRCLTTPRLLVGGVSWRCGHLGVDETCRANKMRLPR